MRVTRALLLSSQKQAESWEYTGPGILRWKKYRYLVEDRYDGSNIRFRVFRVHQERDKESTRVMNIVKEEPHVDETFANRGELINFLHRYQIDAENSWEPVEPA